MTCVLIEDDIAWRSKLQIMIDELSITLLGVATTVAEGIELLQKHKPDFILADILLQNELVFCVFDNHIKSCGIPTIFLTATDKEVYYNQANKILARSLYVVKPIHKLTLKSAIENLAGSINKTEIKKIESFKVKGKYNETIDVPFDKIVYLSQALKYCTIHTPNKQFTIKKSMQDAEFMLDDRFLRVHGSFCINTDYIQSIGVGLQNIKLSVNDIVVPIGMRYIDNFKAFLAKKNITTL